MFRFKQLVVAVICITIVAAFPAFARAFVKQSSSTIPHAQQDILSKTTSKVECQQKSPEVVVSCLTLKVVKINTSSIVHPQSCPSAPSTSRMQPECLYSYCPSGIINAKQYNSNEAIFYGTVTNDCGVDLIGGQVKIVANIYCPGANNIAGPATATGFIGNWANGVTYSYSLGVVGRCEYCDGGVATDFPPFTLFANLIPSGYASGNSFVNDPADQDSIGLPNSSNYVFPC
jgi:hypothetical protein